MYSLINAFAIGSQEDTILSKYAIHNKGHRMWDFTHTCQTKPRSRVLHTLRVIRNIFQMWKVLILGCYRSNLKFNVNNGMEV